MSVNYERLSAAIAQKNALLSGKRRPAAIKLKRVALETSAYETTEPGGYRCAKVRAYTRVGMARGKNYHLPAKTERDRSLVRSQILRARDNYANTLPRWSALRADDDKTQILTPTALKRENKGNSETRALRGRG